MCIFHTCLHVMLFYTPSQIHNPSNINALKIVNQISLPLIFFTPQWIFFFGHVSIHFWHWKQSPSTFQETSVGSPILAGHFLVQALHFGMHASLSRCKEKSGSTGIRENTAPSGQKFLQKNLSSRHIPTIRSSNITSPVTYPPSLKLPACIIENTSHGLVPCALLYMPP